MNLKKAFYRDYYQGIDLKKFEDKEKQKKIDEKNAPVFQRKNKEITGFKPDLANVQKCFSWLGDLPDPIKDPIHLATTYPGLFAGSGYTHETGNEGEFKLGFFFDHTTGLPIIPGSSVKGVLRSLFPQFNIPDPEKPLAIEPPGEGALQAAKCEYIAGVFGVRNDHELVHCLELAIFESLDVIQTQQSKKPVYLPNRSRDIFLDAYIVQSFAPGGRILADDALTPHNENPLKNPVPLPFLKVCPGVVFEFPIILQDSIYGEGLVLKASDKKNAFEKILLQIGIGAKTNVGYGQFVSPADYFATFGDKSKEKDEIIEDKKENTEKNQVNKKKEEAPKKENPIDVLDFRKLASGQYYAMVLPGKEDKHKRYGDIKRLEVYESREKKFQPFRAIDKSLQSFPDGKLLIVSIQVHEQNPQQVVGFTLISELES